MEKESSMTIIVSYIKNEESTEINVINKAGHKKAKEKTCKPE